MSLLFGFDADPRDPKPYPDWRALRSLGGRREWNARTYLPDTHHLLKPGQVYSLKELVERFNLPTRYGSPYLHPHNEGDPIPSHVVFIVEPLA